MSPSTSASASGSRATLARKLVPRSSIDRLMADVSSQLRRGFERCLDDRRVARATAEMSGQHVADFGLIRIGAPCEQRIERYQDARGAEPALQGVVLPEG